MNSSIIFVLALVTIVMVTGLVRTWLQQRDSDPEKNAELEETMIKIEQLEERIKVLERIITENRFDLKKEIDML